MLADQLYYTSCERGVLDSPGFQILACTNSISAQERKEIQALLTYTPADDLPLRPKPEELDRFPVHRGHTWLSTGRQVVFQSTYRGAGHGGRMGNYFGHALVFDATPLPLSSAQRDWSSVLLRCSPETEAHVAATGDTALAPLDIDFKGLGSPPDLQTTALASWLSEGDRLAKASGLLHVVFDRQASPTSKRLVLVGPEELTLRWTALLQLSIPQAWQSAADYGTYLPEPEKSACAIACRPALKSGMSNHSLQRVAVVVNVEGSAGWPAENADTKVWLQSRWQSLASGSETTVEQQALHYHAPRSAAQFLAGLSLLESASRREITASRLNFIRHCAKPEGWNSFWWELESIDGITAEQACELAGFLSAVLSDPQEGARAWQELVALPETALSRLAHDGSDTRRLAEAITNAAGPRMHELLTELHRNGWLETLDAELSGATPGSAVMVGHLIDWASTCKAGSVSSDVASTLIRLAACARSKASASLSKSWLTSMPQTWLPAFAAECLKCSPVTELNTWLVACKGEHATATLLQWNLARTSLSTVVGMDEWLELAARHTFGQNRDTNADQAYKVMVKQASSLDESMRSALFTAFVGTQSPAQIAAACIDYLRSARKVRTPRPSVSSVCRLLDEHLPLGIKPSLKAKDLEDLLTYVAPLGAPQSNDGGALTAQWMVVRIADGSPFATVKSASQRLIPWFAQTGAARLGAWATSLGLAMGRAVRSGSDHADVLKLVARLGTDAMGDYILGLASSTVGTGGGLVALFGFEFEDGLRQDVLQNLRAHWAKSSYRQRAELCRQLVHFRLTPKLLQLCEDWVAGLSAPPKFLSKVIQRIIGRRSS